MKNLVLTVTILVGIVTGCAQRAELESADTTSPEAIAQAQLGELPKTDLYSNGVTKLIKTAHYRFQVSDVKKSSEAIELAIQKYPAYISASDMKLDNPILENKITVRIQNEYFQELLKDIDKQALYVNFRDVKTEDVAKQFVDLESRLKTKREVEQRYMEILRSKAGTIEELLEAERQIGNLHEEIEATVSRINYLRDEVRYSTIELEFYQTINTKVATVDEIGAGSRLSDAVGTGWNSVVTVVVGLVYLWPIFLLAAAGFFGYRYARRRGVQL
ncbi:MAG: DUF4349 domain-containing protein [Bacteroidota bacterium]